MAKKDAKPFDFSFFLIVLGLLAFGLIMVFSSSSESAKADFGGDALYFFKRQGIWAGISIVAMLIISKIDYRKIAKLSWLAMLLAVVFLIGVLVFGTVVKGGKRWLDLGFISFQPSEFAKIAIILFFSQALSKNSETLKKFFKGLLPYLGVVGFFCILIMLEPHLSGTIVIVLVSVIMIYVAGANGWHLGLLGIPAVVGVIGLIVFEPYRLKRVTAFIDPFKDRLGEGWQVIQSLYAIGSGGLLGLGLGRSRQKFLYIPEPHNDFIFSILCEEMGLVGALVAISLFAMLIYKGITIAMHAEDTVGCLMATGITSLVAVEVIINLAVVTSSMPVTGMPLPFFSYGGTALLMHMCAMGIMLNISRSSHKGA